MVAIAQMKALVMVSDKGSLAAAARELGISSAAVSKQLILLEKDLGLQLMTRTTRIVEFTEIGKSYCDQCKRILEELDVATALVDQMKTIPQGYLVVPEKYRKKNIFPDFSLSVILKKVFSQYSKYKKGLNCISGTFFLFFLVFQGWVIRQ